MLKTEKTLNNLLKIYRKDFPNKNIFSYEELEKEIIKSIKESERSIKEHKIEAIAKKVEEENRQAVGQMALIVSLITSFLSLFNSILFFSMDDRSANYSHLIVVLLFLFLLYITVFIGNEIQTKSKNIAAYYTVKLYCIEIIEKENRVKPKTIKVRINHKKIQVK